MASIQEILKQKQYRREAQRWIGSVQDMNKNVSRYLETSIPFLAEKAAIDGDTTIATAPFKTFLTSIQGVIGEFAVNIKQYLASGFATNEFTVANNYNTINQEVVERYLETIDSIDVRHQALIDSAAGDTRALQRAAGSLYRELSKYLLGEDSGMFKAVVWYVESLELEPEVITWIEPYKTLSESISTTLTDYTQTNVRVSDESIETITKNTLEVLSGIFVTMEKHATNAIDALAKANGGTITPPPVETPTVGSLTGDTTASTTDGAGTFSITVDYGTTDGTTPATGSVSTDDTNWTCTDTVCTATTGATTGNVVVTATSSNGLTIPTLTVVITNTDTPVDGSTPATLTADTTMTATNGIGALNYTLTEGLLADGTTSSTTTIALTASGSATGTCDAGSCSVTGAVDGETLTLTATTDTPKGVTGSPATVTVSNTVIYPVESIQINGDSSATITGTAGAATGTYTINVTDGGQDASGEIISATYNPTAIAATTGTGTMTLGTKNINATTGVGTVTYDITNATVGDIFTLNKEDIVSATLGNGTTGTGSGVKVTITPNPIVVTLA